MGPLIVHLSIQFQVHAKVAKIAGWCQFPHPPFYEYLSLTGVGDVAIQTANVAVFAYLIVPFITNHVAPLHRFTAPICECVRVFRRLREGASLRPRGRIHPLPKLRTRSSFETVLPRCVRRPSSSPVPFLTQPRQDESARRAVRLLDMDCCFTRCASQQIVTFHVAPFLGDGVEQLLGFSHWQS